MKRKYHDKFNSAQRTMHQEKVYYKNPEPQKEYEKKSIKKILMKKWNMKNVVNKSLNKKEEYYQ